MGENQKSCMPAGLTILFVVCVILGIIAWLIMGADAANAAGRCPVVVSCKLRSGCWPRDPVTGRMQLAHSLGRGAQACPGRGKVLSLRDWRGRSWELSLMELPGYRDKEGRALWYRVSDFRLTGTP